MKSAQSGPKLGQIRPNFGPCRSSKIGRCRSKGFLICDPDSSNHRANLADCGNSAEVWPAPTRIWSKYSKVRGHRSKFEVRARCVEFGPTSVMQICSNIVDFGQTIHVRVGSTLLGPNLVDPNEVENYAVIWPRSTHNCCTCGGTLPAGDRGPLGNPHPSRHRCWRHAPRARDRTSF